MSFIKPRTRGKQFMQHRTRLDRENHETLYAYAAFIAEEPEYVLNELIDTVLGEGQGLPGQGVEHPRIRAHRDRSTVRKIRVGHRGPRRKPATRPDGLCRVRLVS